MHISMFGGAIGDLIGSWFQKLVDFITGFFAFIPQVIYFIYASCASLLDFLQYIIRKLAGLDVYYVNGEPQTGDIVTSFIRGALGIDKAPQYSALTTVFWSLVIFGVVLLVLTTIFQIIKSHYNYDSNKSNPVNIIISSFKSLCTMAVVPIVAVFGFYLSNIVLQTLDHITSNSSESSVAIYLESDAISKLESGKIRRAASGESEGDIPESYSAYDFFSFGSYTNTPTFSGVMFKIAGYNASRVRRGTYRSNPSGNWDNCGIFGSSSNDANVVADQIDYAFANNLHLKDSHTIKMEGDDDWVLASSYAVGYSALIYLEMINFKSFSKFNVGLIWYYYNLWGFNFFLAFAGIAALLTLMVSIVFGLITRLIQLLALFLVFPPLIGIMPLDEGNAYKNWKKQFIADVLMVFGAVIGMNIFFLILPFINSISFFGVGVLDSIMNIFIMLAGLVMVKKFISLTASFIGASDAIKEGEETRKGVSEVGKRAMGSSLKAARVGIAAGKLTGITPGIIGGSIKAGVALKNYRDKKHAEDPTYAFMKEYRQKKRKEKWEESWLHEKVEGVKGGIKKGKEKISGVATNISNSKFGKFLKGAGQVMGGVAEVITGSNFGILNPKKEASAKPKAESKDEKKPTATASAGAGTTPPPGATDEKKEEKANSPLKAFGKGLLDLGDSAIKLIGDLTGASNAFASLKKAGVVDEAKETIQSFYQAVGATDLLKAAQHGETKLSTEKQSKDDKEKEAVKKMREDMSATATNMANMKAEIQKLIETVQKKK